MQPTATTPEPGPSPFSFRDFRARLKEPGAAQLMRELKVVISEFGAAPPEAGEHERVQEALGQLEQRMVGSGPWASASDQVLQGSREGLEKYLMTAIHGRAWLSREEDVERDRRLDTKVEALTGFITADHLDIPPCFHHDEAWGVARKELMRVNDFKAPRDKLVCVLNCCKVVNVNLKRLAQQAHHNAGKGTQTSISADDFLPVLIFVVLHARVPHLWANVQYIARYRHASRMVGEAAYHFTNLNSVVCFLENCGAADFSIEPSVFDAAMGGEYTGLAASSSSSGRVGSEALDKNGAPTSDLDELQRAVAAVVQPHRFASCAASDLRVGDVEQLLVEYKLLAKAYDLLTVPVDEPSELAGKPT